jgi:hypothetical protein
VRKEEKWVGLAATVIATFCVSPLIPLPTVVKAWPSYKMGNTHKSKKLSLPFSERPKFEEDNCPLIDPFAGTGSAGCAALLLGVDFIGCKYFIYLLYS